MKDLITKGIGFAKTYDFLYEAKNRLKHQNLFEWIDSQPKDKRINMHQILRTVLTGKKSAPPNKQIVDIIGTEETLSRIDKAMDILDEQYDFKQLYEL